LKKKVILKKKEKKREKLAKKKKEGEESLWITVVIHSDLGVGGTVIPSHHLDIVIII